MSHNFKISEHDYLLANRLNVKWTRNNWVLNIVINALVILVFMFSHGPIKCASFWAIIASIVLYFFLVFVVLPIMSKINYRKYPSIKQEFSIELKETGIKLKCSGSDNLLAWGNIIKWRENSDYILAYTMPVVFHIIPKRIVESGFSISELREALNSHVGKSI